MTGRWKSSVQEKVVIRRQPKAPSTPTGAPAQVLLSFRSAGQYSGWLSWKVSRHLVSFQNMGQKLLWVISSPSPESLLDMTNELQLLFRRRGTLINWPSATAYTLRSMMKWTQIWSHQTQIPNRLGKQKPPTTVSIIIVKLQCVQSTKRPVLLSPVKRLDKDKSFLCTRVGPTGQRKILCSWLQSQERTSCQRSKTERKAQGRVKYSQPTACYCRSIPSFPLFAVTLFLAQG